MNTPHSQRILGIDPGYDRLGWAVADLTSSNITLLAAGCIQTNKKQTLFTRYLQIQQELTTVLRSYTPTEAALETLFFSKNTTTALPVSESRGVVIGLLLQHGCTIFEYRPVEIKQAVTGSGSADKKAVEKMVRAQLHVPAKPLLDDTLDAAAICITHATKGRVTKLLSRIA